MNDQNNKMNPEETPKDEKMQLTDDEAEKAAGGAGKRQKEIKQKDVGDKETSGGMFVKVLDPAKLRK